MGTALIWVSLGTLFPTNKKEVSGQQPILYCTPEILVVHGHNVNSTYT